MTGLKLEDRGGRAPAETLTPEPFRTHANGSGCYEFHRTRSTSGF